MQFEDEAVGAVRTVGAPAGEIARRDDWKIRAYRVIRDADSFGFPVPGGQQAAESFALRRIFRDCRGAVILPKIVNPAVEAAHQCRSDGVVPGSAIYLCSIKTDAKAADRIRQSGRTGGAECSGIPVAVHQVRKVVLRAYVLIDFRAPPV